jgi:hypothetical protein
MNGALASTAMAVVAAQRMAKGFGVGGDAVWKRTTSMDESIGTHFTCFTGTKSTNSDAEGAASQTQSAHASVCVRSCVSMCTLVVKAQ